MVSRASRVIPDEYIRETLGGRYHPGAHLGAVLRTLFSISPWRNFGAGEFPCSDRQEWGRFVERLLRAHCGKQETP